MAFLFRRTSISVCIFHICFFFSFIEQTLISKTRQENWARAYAHLSHSHLGHAALNRFAFVAKDKRKLNARFLLIRDEKKHRFDLWIVRRSCRRSLNTLPSRDNIFGCGVTSLDVQYRAAQYGRPERHDPKPFRVLSFGKWWCMWLLKGRLTAAIYSSWRMMCICVCTCLFLLSWLQTAAVARIRQTHVLCAIRQQRQSRFVSLSSHAHAEVSVRIVFVRIGPQNECWHARKAHNQQITIYLFLNAH